MKNAKTNRTHKTYQKMNTQNITAAETGDIFIGYGIWGKQGQGNVALVSKNNINDEVYAVFVNIKKDGTQGNLYCAYKDGAISDWHRNSGTCITDLL